MTVTNDWDRSYRTPRARCQSRLKIIKDAELQEHVAPHVFSPFSFAENRKRRKEHWWRGRIFRQNMLARVLFCLCLNRSMYNAADLYNHINVLELGWQRFADVKTPRTVHDCNTSSQIYFTPHPESRNLEQPLLNSASLRKSRARLWRARIWSTVYKLIITEYRPWQ